LIPSQIDSGTLEHEPTRVHSDAEDEFRFCKGNYLGIVRRCENQYEFLVRDIRREGPTIHGNGVDFANATAAVIQLMDALMP
jgi:hypothetical protein